MLSKLHVINIDDVPTVYSIHSSPEPVARLPGSSSGDEGLIRFTSGKYCLPGDDIDPVQMMPECMAFLWKACITANSYTKTLGLLPTPLDWPVHHSIICMVERNALPHYDDLTEPERDRELY
jgi:hypothetical protein